MVRTYKFKSPAKINIGLRVLSKRSDGFHNIETIFYPVEIYDEITLRIGKISGAKNSISAKITPDLKISDKENICYKAAELFLKEFKINDSYQIDIKIKKTIPAGAGLGGGSSNAASVLLVLSNYFKSLLEKNHKAKLKKIALSLGSDVPFFLEGKPAYAAGRGEKLVSLPGFKVKGKILIVNPGIHVPTPWAYRELKIINYKLKILNKVKIYNPADERLMINDFERVVFEKFPVIEKIKYDMFSKGAGFALMSGSGSTVYGIFSVKDKIKAAEKYFRGLKYKVFTA
jgi:4-diphosphocytidyl-2-C-methyl-D-erythritol kinase